MPSELTKTDAYEANPYRPDLPEGIMQLSEELFRFLREIIQTLREQHNLIQAGDTTFPWEDLTQFNDIKQYNVGALGRFLHPSYGIITARYVQFTQVTDADDAAIGVVAGFTRTRFAFNWSATTRFAGSSATDSIGLVAGYGQPSRDQYGWVIVNGINLRALRFQSTTAPIIGTKLTWNDSETVTNGELGTVVGTVVSLDGIVQLNSAQWEIAPACVRVEVFQQSAQPENDTPPVITPEQLQEIVEAVAEILNLSVVTANVAALQLAVQSLQNGLTAEEQARLGADNNFANQMIAVNLSLTNLTNALNATNDAVDANANFAANQLTAAAANLQAAIDANGVLIQSEKEANIAQDGRISNLEATDPIRAAAIADLQTSVDALESQIITVLSDIATLQVDLGTLQTNFDALVLAVQDPGTPVAPTLTSPWTDAGAPYAPIEYRKSVDGVVRLTGACAAPLLTPTTVVLFTLPVGFCPAETHMFIGRCDMGVFEIMVEATGDVTISSAGLTYSDLGFVQFIAA